ncbi:MAG: Panacea domain-containing protein [Rubrobacter sp.]
MILYVADKCEDDRTFGAVKLNKILFYADFISFAEYGEPITGVKYRKFQQGPVPTILKRVRFEMEESGEVVVRKKSYHGRMQHRLIPLRPPNFDLLRARDIALVDDVIQMLWNCSAQEVSELSHDRAWRNASEGEAIPYEAAFVSDEPLTKRDVAIAEEMIAEYERFEQSAGRS